MVSTGILISFMVMIVLMILGVPVIAWLGIGTFLLLELTGALPTSLIGESMFGALDSFPLIAIPLFILTGDVLAGTGLSTKLLDFSRSIFSGFRSALGTSTLVGCGLFAAISGSNASAAAAVGRMTHKPLSTEGYEESYAAALIASGSSVGILIPPSIAYIIAGVTLGISASVLFLAAFIPGILVLVTLILVNIIMNRKNNYEQSTGHPDLREIGTATWDAKYALLIPFIILGGIYSGIFTATEAAAVAVTFTIIIGMGIRTLHLSDFPAMFERSAAVNGVIVPIIGVAIIFSQVLSALGLPAQMVSILTSITTNFYLIVLIMLVILMGAGAVMETTPNILILGPLLLPVAESVGMDPIHFVIFMVSGLGIGFMTPPIGLNLYVMAGMTDESVLDISRKSVPYILSMILIVFIIGIAPVISLVLI